MAELSCLVLAAGKGTRMKSEEPKALFEILGKPLLKWVLDGVRSAGIHDICVVLGYKKEKVINCIGQEYQTCEQNEQLGTGHAVISAKDFIKKHATILVLCTDTPLIRPETIEALFKFHSENHNSATVLSADVGNPEGYGRIIRDIKGGLFCITEERDCDDSQREIKEINTGIYCFETGDLLPALENLSNNNSHGEYYLTDTIGIIGGAGKKVGVFETGDEEEIMGINDRVQLAQAESIAKARVNTALMLSGVTICDPLTAYIGPDVEIGPDTTILPSTMIIGNTKIGEGCVIGPNAHLNHMILGNNIRFNASQAFESEISDGANVGPFAYIRPGCRIGKKVKIGDFVEVKNSNIDEGTKVPHLTYVGDADVGKRVNFGCGSVIANLDGRIKHRTTVEDDAFIGCNTNLVSPVKVGKRAYTAAGSTITDEVPDDALAIARARQVNKEGWVKNRK